jgi:hypothetical protein
MGCDGFAAISLIIINVDIKIAAIIISCGLIDSVFVFSVIFVSLFWFTVDITRAVAVSFVVLFGCFFLLGMIEVVYTNNVIIPLENVRIRIRDTQGVFIVFATGAAMHMDAANSLIAIVIGLGFVINVIDIIILAVDISLLFFDLQNQCFYFWEMFYIGFVFFICGFFSIFYYYFRYMVVLLSLEMLMISLFCFSVVFFFGFFVSFPVLFFLLVFVCMGGFGLSLLVFCSRGLGVDYVSSGYFNEFSF